MEEKRSSFSETDQADIVERVAQGQKMAEVCAMYRIKLNDFKRLVRKDTLFWQEILEAEKIAVRCRLDQIPTIIAENDPQTAKLYLDHAKFMATKLDRETFGEKMELNVNNKIDLSDVLTNMQERVARIPQAYLSTEIVESLEPSELEELLK